MKAKRKVILMFFLSLMCVCVCIYIDSITTDTDALKYLDNFNILCIDLRISVLLSSFIRAEMLIEIWMNV